MMSQPHRFGLDRLGETRSIFAGVASDERERMLASHSFRFRHEVGRHPSMRLPEIGSLQSKCWQSGAMIRSSTKRHVYANSKV